MTDTPTITEALDDLWRWLPPLPEDIPDLPPLTGIVTLDVIAAELLGDRDVDFDDPDARRRFTATLIGAALPPTVTTYLSLGQLRADWPHLDLPAPVRRRWERAFPVLAPGHR